MQKIINLKAKQCKINIQAEVLNITSPKEFNILGRSGRIANATIKDDSGKILLTLWDDEITQISQGDKIKINNGYINETHGTLQLLTGRFGNIEVVKEN